MSAGKTLLATASEPCGEWNAITLDKAYADPSLFWDDDATCWCSYTAWTEKGTLGCLFDFETGAFRGEPVYLWSGAFSNTVSPEASNIYKKDGWYYLMISEGGTEHYNAVCIARSKALDGPYETCPANPILTHRHLSDNYPVCNVGHGDILEAGDGKWYMVCLASRLVGGYHKPLGRATFLYVRLYGKTDD